MEKNTQTIEGKVSFPILPEEVSFKGNLNLSCRQVRETITLTSGAWVGLEGKGLVRVNSSLYNLKYYDLIPSDSTQKKVIQKGLKQILPKTPPTPHTTKSIKTEISKHTPGEELTQIELIGRLIKKVSSWVDKKKKAQTTKDENKFILLGRQLKKDRTLIDQYLTTLSKDICFSISDKFLVYKGEFASCKRLLPEGGI